MGVYCELAKDLISRMILKIQVVMGSQRKTLIKHNLKKPQGHLFSDPEMKYQRQDMADGMTCFMEESK